MTHVVVRVGQQADGGFFSSLERAPKQIAGARRVQTLVIRDDIETRFQEAAGVRAYGAEIMQALRQNQAIAEAIDDALAAAAGESHPILFSLSTADAGDLLWETIWDDGRQQFCALGGQWPIARIAESPTIDDLGDYEYQPPLRLMAVLSALGLPAQSEWLGLYDAVRAERGQGLRIHLHVLAGEEALLREMETAAASDPDLTVQAVPDGEIDLLRCIANAAPHIVHFFCHGIGRAGVQQVIFGSLSDWDGSAAASSATGSVVLNYGDLVNNVGIARAWLVALNCCEGARGPSGAFSMAQLLAESAVPAVVGVLEPWDAIDAYEFSHQFYPELLGMVRRAIDEDPADRFVELSWPDLLHAPRRQLSGNAPQDRRNWALPVLYLHGARFRVIRCTAVPTLANDARLRAMVEFQKIESFLQTLPADTPQAARRELEVLRDNARDRWLQP